MSKIRPKNIIKGFTSDHTEKSKNRLLVCSGCEFRNKLPLKLSNCQVCGCLVDAKSKVEEESCPMNRWKDIKKIEKKGIIVGNLSEDITDISVVDEGVIFTFKDVIKKGGPGKVNLRVINDRAGEAKQFKADELDLTHLKVKVACGCTTTSDSPTELAEGDNFDLTLSYDTERIGAFEKNVRVMSLQEEFYIQIKGEVKN